MKIVKATLIVCATLIAVLALLFFGSALIGGYNIAKARHVKQELSFTMDNKLDSLNKIYSGKSLVVEGVGSVLMNKYEFQDNNELLAFIKNGEKVEFLGIDLTTKKAKIKYKRLTGYIHYYDISIFKSVAMVDPEAKDSDPRFAN